MLRKKILKLICVLVALIVTSPFILFQVSANDEVPLFEFGGLDITDVVIESTRADGSWHNSWETYQTYLGKINVGGKSVHAFRLEKVDETAWSGNRYNIRVTMKGQSYTENAPYFYGSFKIGFPREQGTILNSDTHSASFIRTGNTTQYGSYSIFSDTDNGIRGYNVIFSPNEIGMSFRYYVCSVHTSVSARQYIDVYLYDSTLKTYSAEEFANQQIIDNQNSNTDKIVNGWQQENEIDTSTTDDYAAQEQELQGATEQGRSQTISVFNSFGSLFANDGHLYKGLLSVSSIFTEFFKIDWISSLINFSLALGVFAFVIGTGSAVFKSSHEKHEHKKERRELSD